jgi:thioredoxin reductase
MKDSGANDVMFDVLIAAGSSAALVLGRACRTVLLCDTSMPRSWASKAMHGFLSRDGVAPADFRRVAREELARYPNVTFREAEVRDAVRRPDGGFDARVGDERVTCRKLLIATGVLDELPRMPGLVERFGSSVFQCPYCDGWELRGLPLAAYGTGRRGMQMARALTAWSDDLVLFTDGPSRLSAQDREELRANDIEIVTERIEGLIGAGTTLEAVVLRGGRAVARRALFFDMPSRGQSRLAESLGCRFTRHGGIKCGQYEATSVPGVFVAGNIIRDVQLAIVAAAEGARAAFGINKSLTREAFVREATGRTPVDHPDV